MLLFFVITSVIVILFYFFISKYNMKEEYELKDITNGIITRIRGDYIDITCNGENIRIVKEDGNCWYYKKDNEKKELKYESIFKVGGGEFKIIRTEKRDGIFILIPLITTVITILALFFQTNTLIKESEEKSEIEKNNVDTTIATLVDTDLTTTKDDNSSPTEDDNSSPTEDEKEDDLQTKEDSLSNNDEFVEVADIHSFVESYDDLFKEDITVDWESFQETEKQRRSLLNNPSEAGIQVSKYQDDIDWEKVKADGIDYAIIQAGSRGYEMGGLIEDPYFKKNMNEATANGIKVGVSFHSQAINREEMDEEIELIMKSIKGYNLDYPIGITLLQEENYRTIDLTYNEYVDLIKYFCICIKQKGYTPMIMGTADWFAQFSEGKDFDGYLKMVYDHNMPPSNINNCIIWIYRINKKVVNGIKDDLDVAINVSAYIDENEH